MIEARAKMRIADEYDAAQERGEVEKHGGMHRISNIPNVPLAATAASPSARSTASWWRAAWRGDRLAGERLVGTLPLTPWVLIPHLCHAHGETGALPWAPVYPFTSLTPG